MQPLSSYLCTGWQVFHDIFDEILAPSRQKWTVDSNRITVYNDLPACYKLTFDSLSEDDPLLYPRLDNCLLCFPHAHKVATFYDGLIIFRHNARDGIRIDSQSSKGECITFYLNPNDRREFNDSDLYYSYFLLHKTSFKTNNYSPLTQ